jgi:hypothetical protein
MQCFGSGLDPVNPVSGSVSPVNFLKFLVINTLDPDCVKIQIRIGTIFSLKCWIRILSNEYGSETLAKCGCGFV